MVFNIYLQPTFIYSVKHARLNGTCHFLEKRVNGETTVSGASTVLSAIAQLPYLVCAVLYDFMPTLNSIFVKSLEIR